MKNSLRFVLLSVLILNFLMVSIVMAEDSNENFFTLDEIVVIASKYPEKLSDIVASVEIINEEDIKNTNVRNVADLLKNLTSVHINDYAGVAGLKTISIRGSKDSQVLVLLDGQPMNSRQNGLIDLGQLTTVQIERIEVLKGPASALYGANALGGVVNIITKGGSEKPVTNFNLEYGSFDTNNYVFSHRNREGKVGYNLVMAKKSSDGHRENSGLEQTNLFMKFDYQLDKYSNLIFSFQHNDSEIGVPGSITYLSPNAEEDDTDTNLNLQCKQKKEKADMNFAIYHNIHELAYDSGYGIPSDHDTNRTGMDFNRTTYHNLNTLTYGFEIKYNEVDSTEAGKHDTLNQALFVQDEWRFSEPLKLSLGVRYDDHEKFDSEICPRFGAVYTLSPKMKLHASYGKAYRTPTFNDLYYETGSYAEGNPDLKPETAKSYELGLRFLKQGLKGEINLFNNDVEDLISWAAGNDGIWRPYNINSAQTKGAELILNKELNDNFSIDFNYTYLDSKDKDTDKQLIPHHKVDLGLIYNKNDLTAVLKERTVASRENDQKDYSVIDAKVSKKIVLADELIDLSLEVNNLFDEEYEVIKNYPMAERNCILKLSTEF